MNKRLGYSLFYLISLIVTNCASEANFKKDFNYLGMVSSEALYMRSGNNYEINLQDYVPISTLENSGFSLTNNYSYEFSLNSSLSNCQNYLDANNIEINNTTGKLTIDVSRAEQDRECSLVINYRKGLDIGELHFSFTLYKSHSKLMTCEEGYDELPTVDQNINLTSQSLYVGNTVIVRWDEVVDDSPVVYSLYASNDINNFPDEPQTEVTDQGIAVIPFINTAEEIYIKIKVSICGRYINDLTTPVSFEVREHSSQPLLNVKNTGASPEVINGLYPHEVAEQGLFAYALRTDSLGNLYFHDYSRTYVLYAICNNVKNLSNNGFCANKDLGKIYPVAGDGVRGIPTHDVPATQSHLNELRGMAIDKNGNLILAEYREHYVLAVCYNTSATGPCKNKTVGNIYKIAGTGVEADAFENVDPTTSSLDYPADIAIDKYNNIYVSIFGSPRILVICYNITEPGHFCEGKTTGYMYYFAGTGVLGLTTNGGAALTENIGSQFGLEFDSHDNLYFADVSTRTVHVVCNYDNGSLGGFCSGKSSGHIYRVIGDNTLGDSAGNEQAENAKVNPVRTVTLDGHDNIWILDNFRRIRVRCEDVVSSGFCQGKTQGFLYNYTSGSLENYNEDVTVAAGALEFPGTGALRYDKTSGDLYFGSTTGLIVRIIQ